MKPFKRLGGIKFAVIGALAAAVLAYAGYRVFFARTGEAAVAYIPADANFVVTLDSHPSDSQIGAFRKLADALHREGLDTDLENGVNDIIGKAGIAKEVRAHLTHNLALAFWNRNQGNSDGIVLFAIDDAEAVRNIIASGKRSPGSVEAYSFGSPNFVCSVLGDYLAIASSPEIIGRAASTQASGDSIASLPEYRDARSALPADANLMFFMSPRAIADIQKSTGANFAANRWMAVGAALRDGGIEFTYRGPVDAKKVPAIGELSKIAPFELGVLRNLPEGALGLLAYSQPAKYFPVLESSMKGANSGEEWDKGVNEFERETGISVKDDLLPGLQGDLVLAVYPDSGAHESVDGLVLADGASGANPTALVAKVRAWIDRKNAEVENGLKVQFVETKIGATTLWLMDEKSAAEFRKAAAGSGSKSPWADKNIGYAVKDGVVVVGSSRPILVKAAEAMNGGHSLADDPAFANMTAKVDHGAQGVWMMALPRILEVFRPQIEKSLGTDSDSREDFLQLFGAMESGLVASGRVEGDVARGTLFLPLDFDHMASLIHRLKDVQGKPRPPADPPITR